MVELPINIASKPSIGVAIPTLRAKRHLHHCLPPYLDSPLKPRVLVIDSTSDDGTVDFARSLGAETLVIPRHDFNHGRTRELARKYLGTDIIVMATQDCYPVNRSILETLLKPLLDNSVSIAYARQIPHVGAGPFEAFARTFNYPSESHIRGVQNIDKYGIYTFFCSNSCAAYLNSALEEIGGFEPALLGEDAVATAKLLQRGHKIAYVAEALVRHSHHYSLKEEFQRSFETGLARRCFSHLISAPGGDSRRGREYVRALSKHLWQKWPHLLPYAALQTAIKWLGYNVGRHSYHAPTWLKKQLSSQKFYWQ